jgi:hypothetical protein
MDQNVIGEDRRTHIYNILADSLIQALENRLITDQESAESSQYILDHIGPTQTEEQLKQTLREIAEKWPFYQPALTQILAEEQKVEDTQQIHQIQNELNNIQQ